MGRFFTSPEWRWVLTDFDFVTLGVLDRICTNRTVVTNMNAPSAAEGVVPSENQMVNLLHTDGAPRLSEGDRFLFGFRHEASAWSVRHSGIVMSVQTVADEDRATTRFVSYDPWQLMYKRPVRDEAGTQPGVDGLVFENMTGHDILIQLLETSDLYDGPTYIDWENGPDLDQTATSVIGKITFQQGMMIGEAMDELVATGEIDIALTPIYNRDGAYGSLGRPVLSFLKTGNPIGTVLEGVDMAWDKPGRTLLRLDDLWEGSGRENAIHYHFGQGGDQAGTANDITSQNRFGTYWSERFFPGQTAEVAVELMAFAILAASARGKRTLTVSPVPERAKQPFVDYLPGDRINVNASTAALIEIAERQRVLSIPVQIDDVGVETVNNLLFVDEGWPDES